MTRKGKRFISCMMPQNSPDAAGEKEDGESRTKSPMSQSFLIELRKRIEQSTDHDELLRTLIERHNREPFFSCESGEFADRMKKLIQVMGGAIEDDKKEHSKEIRKEAWKKRLSSLQQEWKGLEDNEWS